MIRVIRCLSVCALVFTIACSSSSSPSSPSAVNVPFSTSDVIVGGGSTVAAAGSTVVVNYSGWLYSATAAENKGTPFDAGTFTFRLGTGQVIAGFDRGVTGMRAGGTRRIVIPPDLGYGSTPQTRIPANSTLLFEVTVVSIT